MTLKEPYLEVTYRQGKPLAAYYYLPRESGAKSDHCQRFESGLVVDFNRSGAPIGIEITAPDQVTLAILNEVLRRFGLPEATQSDIAPLQAA